MKMKQILIGLILVGYFAPAGNCADDFKPFWSKFKQALQKNDKEAIASMTKLPYTVNDKPLNRAQFLKRYNSIFTPATRKCLTSQKPVGDQQAWEVFCGEEIFIFQKVNGKYLFVEIGVND